MSPASLSIDIDGPSPAVSAEALSALGKETFTDTFGHLYSPENLQKFLTGSHNVDAYASILSDPSYGVWTATTKDGELIGYLVAGPCKLPVDDLPANAGELARFYIKTDFQGGGLGNRMLDLALAWLHQNFSHVYLSVYSENHKAQRLYERRGFQKVQRYHFMVGDHADPEFIMKHIAV